ncbi:two component transcriptional regulator, winged helix family [Alicyclobacillus hesperidum URH17-3-68]|uniref:DNA-binding response regulator n=1 Tax=Alicyclobacillus hesperidum TaxID=89784 RepID=A0A1H2QDX0_9BACL|nr:response regulator transcription factor [Alicyclobacillus hesperidum]EJY54706.1 two component transcriptional regulator, winged helix family [Alicyclobacillus hesperidum URH17-3-68]KRW92907.1 PhoB family transcriptional regulator [Alicyclobacillus tengchongensis]GLV12679.1 DNA-binding response regulator [Alicyclobacillus hesperidum]SDW05381.1 two-component system, OmpR family, response regulator ArlR [Alicyclobacillus hesperidum]
MRVLLVEDEPGLIEFLTLELELQGVAVDVAPDGESGLALAREHPYDLLLVDIMLPGMNGIELCQAVRMFSNVPLIMLTARGSVADRVDGLNAGADDYLVKPFAIEELWARMRALRRRHEASSTTFRFGETTVQMDLHRVVYRGQDVDLTAREYDLLVYLLRHVNQTCSRNDLLERVWGFHTPGDTNVVDVYIGYLRQKLDPERKYIKTVRGQGYRLEVHDESP